MSNLFQGSPDSEDEFTFYQGLDIHGYDLKYVGKKPVSLLKLLCLATPNCIGFNTLGFLKGRNPIDTSSLTGSSLEPGPNLLKPSPYFGNEDGFYFFDERSRNALKSKYHISDEPLEIRKTSQFLRLTIDQSVKT